MTNEYFKIYLQEFKIYKKEILYNLVVLCISFYEIYKNITYNGKQKLALESIRIN